MKRIILNGKRMITKEVAHAYLKRKFSFPDYYGRNLDALWDLLSTTVKETEIVLVNAKCVPENLGRYGASLLQVFDDLNEENRRVKVIYLN
ncbi:barstar family protein [Proteiniclasticum sp. C24MP]|uniref:barstar family protein n=1 Tax=Proteiniclasticum sp. C24MP TaxID=3374101 RepID=UPI003753F12B